MWGSGESGSDLGSIFITNNTTSFQPQDNFSLSCAARNIQGSVTLPYSETGVIIARVIHAIFTFLIMLIGGFLNIFIVVLVAKFKKLQTVAFGIALEIVAFDILESIFISLFSLITAIANRWLFSKYACSLVGMAIYINVSAKTFLLLIFIIDRLFSVFCTFTYPKYKSRTVAILSVMTLIFAFIMSVTGYILDCYSFNPSFWQCGPYGSCNANCSVFFELNGGFFAFLRILSLFLFGLLYIKARKANKVMPTIAESASTQQTKYNWKATITFFMLFMSFFVLSIPSIAILAFTNAFYGENGETSPTANILSTVAVYIVSLQTIADSIIIMRNGDVREVIKDIKAKIVRRCCHNTSKIGSN